MRAFVAGFALLVCVGMSSAAELSDAERIVLEDQARRDAEKEGDEKFWALATFAGTTLVSPYLSLGALAGAWYYQPAPPAYRFRGKSPVAIEIYTHTYKSVPRTGNDKKGEKMKRFFLYPLCMMMWIVGTGFAEKGHINTQTVGDNNSEDTFQYHAR